MYLKLDIMCQMCYIKAKAKREHSVNWQSLTPDNTCDTQSLKQPYKCSNSVSCLTLKPKAIPAVLMQNYPEAL